VEEDVLAFLYLKEPWQSIAAVIAVQIILSILPLLFCVSFFVICLGSLKEDRVDIVVKVSSEE
jgi:cell division protein FtsX